MIKAPFLAALMALALGACVRPPAPEAPSRADFSQDMIITDSTTPPKGPEGACWQADVKPAVIETVTEQVLIEPARTAEDGTAIPAVYGTETSQRIVEDRGIVWFPRPLRGRDVGGFRRHPAKGAEGPGLLPLAVDRRAGCPHARRHPPLSARPRP